MIKEIHLMADTEILQNLGECRRQVDTGVGARYFNKVEEHWDRDTIVFEMNSDRYVRLVIRRGPCISSIV